MAQFIAHRVAPGIPVWDILCNGDRIGSMTNLPVEKAFCLTVTYKDERLDYRALSAAHVLVALRCAIDAIDARPDYEEDYIPDEDGEIARMRWEEDRAEALYRDEDPF